VLEGAEDTEDIETAKDKDVVEAEVLMIAPCWGLLISKKAYCGAPEISGDPTKVASIIHTLVHSTRNIGSTKA